ncbi:MAG: PAS domain-containing protein [Rhizomicrobium sp.]
MQRANREAAIAAFETFGITGRNHALAAYWLSLWRGERMPMRADFNPARVGALLPGIGLFSVKPGAHSVCRLAGTAIAQATGHELTGLDWRRYTPKAECKVRLERNSAVACGQVAIGMRSRERPDGQTEHTTELQLPFADEAEDGTRQILFHLDWRASGHASTARANLEPPALRIADAFHAISLL